MSLRSLRLRDFRCFPLLSCALADGETIFIGDNAQGKTSILEAVCVLLRLQSPRSSSLKDCVRFGEESFGVAGTLGGRDLTHTFSEGGERRLLLDGLPAESSADYLAAGSLVVWMGNDDRELITGPGEARRRYLDFLGCQLFPAYRPALKAYEKALRSRNLLLKRHAHPPRAQLDAFTRVLAPAGETLLRLRAALVERLEPHAAAAHQAISGTAERLTFTWEPGGDAADLRAQLESLRAEEERRRVTPAGPHRDDVVFSLNGLPAARFASEGQQRTLALALKLAQATLLEETLDEPPVLLLDDVFGELDPARRNALLTALPAGSQKLITTTHLNWLAENPGNPPLVYRVSTGTVAEERFPETGGQAG